jgi:hypothetical protein
MQRFSSIAVAMAPVLRAAGSFLLKWLARLGNEPVRAYRPEAHYMRGPGPAWRAKHQPH